MISIRKTLLLTGALALIGTAAVAAHHMGHGHGHGFGGGRMFEMADANKDGKVTKAEADKAAAERFKKISGGKSSITEAQFAAFKPERKESADHNDRRGNAFKRADWNGDGMLSLQEFSAGPQARFMRADRDGTGSVNCAPKHHKDHAMPPATEGDAAKVGHDPRHHGKRHGMRGGHQICAQADADKNGVVTRAELDASLAAKFASVTKGGSGMTDAQFDSLREDRRAGMREGAFKRLDKNGDGKLTEAEFSAPAAHVFAKLDKNNDGVVEKSELPHRGFKHRGKPEAN